MENWSRQKWERAQAAFYPFVDAFTLPLNPDDVDEILYAVLTHADSEDTGEQIVTQVHAQIQTYLAQTRQTYAAGPPPVTTPAGGERQASGSGQGTWVVWRQDDHGNRAEVARHVARADAEGHVSALEGRGHKQTYWVAPGEN